MLTSVAVLANVNPNYQMISMPLPDRIVYATASIGIVYDITYKNVIATLMVQKQSSLCTAIQYIIKQKKHQIFMGFSSGLLAIFQSQDGIQWKLYSQQKMGSLILSFIEDLPILSDGTIGILNKIKFPPKHRIQLGCRIKQNIYALGSVDKQIHIYKIVQKEWQFCNSLLGHNDCIRSLDCIFHQKDIMLASGSKDGVIRIWRFSQQKKAKFDRNQYFVHQELIARLQSVLYGHQGNVSGLKWVKLPKQLILISCSFDKTVQVWTKDDEFWNNRIRLGQIAGSKNAFFALVANVGRIIVVNFNGSAYHWTYNPDKLNNFKSQVLFTGHCKQIRDIDIDSQGSRIVTCSSDQTTRIFIKNKQGRWGQISRAQVHGWDLTKIRFLKCYGYSNQISDLIISGAQQKVIRILQPPARYINLNNYLSKSRLRLMFPSQQQQAKLLISKQPYQYKVIQQGGTQVLGLMTKIIKLQPQIPTYNKQIDMQPDETDFCQQYPNKVQNKDQYNKFPDQDYLLRNTLWPEIQKLYGHANQISALAVHPYKKIMASACKSLNKTDAAIIIWDVQSYKIMKRLQCHRSTVTDLDIENEYLVSVSKDRQLGIHSLSQLKTIQLRQCHGRQINFVKIGNQMIMTGSRDKTLKIQSIQLEKKIDLVKNFKEGVSAGDWDLKNGIIFVGLQNGNIQFLKFQQNSQLKIIKKFEGLHNQRITRILIRDNMLYSSGQDNMLRIFEIKL